MGIQFSGDAHKFILYPLSQQKIVFVVNSKIAYVGAKKILLRNFIVQTPQTKQIVMSLSDLLLLLHERDMQRHQSPFIRNVQLIYDIRDYHR